MTSVAVKKPRRTRQPKEKRIQQIIDCAEEVFDERGFETATVAEIARRAGVVEGTVFRYFETKYDLVLEVTTRWYAALFDDLISGLQGIVGTRNKLRYIVWSQLTAANERAELTGAVIQAGRSDDKKLASQITALYSRYTQPLFETLDSGARLGEIRPGISHLLVANTIYGGIEQCIWQMLESGQDIDTEQVADDLVDLIFSGIQQAPAKPSTDRGDKLLDRLEALLDTWPPHVTDTPEDPR